MSSGIDYNRTALLLAVLEKRLGLRFSTQDVYVNVAAGMRLVEPASDAACALAMISSYKNQPVPDDIIVLGEIGLAGECRSVSNTNQRINESIRLGFTRIAVPFRSIKSIKVPKDIEVIPLRSVYDLMKLIDN